MGLISKLKLAWLAKRVVAKLKEDTVKTGLLRTVKTLGLAVVPVIVLKLTDACPDLMTPQGAMAVMGGVLASLLLWTKKKSATASVAAAGTAGLAASSWSALQEQISKMCGSDFLTQLPTVLTTALVVGLGAYLSHKKEDVEPDLPMGPKE